MRMSHTEKYCGGVWLTGFWSVPDANDKVQMARLEASSPGFYCPSDPVMFKHEMMRAMGLHRYFGMEAGLAPNYGLVFAVVSQQQKEKNPKIVELLEEIGFKDHGLYKSRGESHPGTTGHCTLYLGDFHKDVWPSLLKEYQESKPTFPDKNRRFE